MNFGVLKRKPASTAQRFSPAPTIPATPPSARLFTNGPTVEFAPFDIFTNKPVSIMLPIANGSQSGRCSTIRPLIR